MDTCTDCHYDAMVHRHDTPALRWAANYPYYKNGKYQFELTATESRVMQLYSRGYSADYIGKRMSLSGRTIETHVRRVFDKVGVHQKDLVLEMTEHGMVW